MRPGRTESRNPLLRREREVAIARRAILAIASRAVPCFRTKGPRFDEGVNEGAMQEKRRVLYKKGVFVCPTCRQSYVQEKWIEEWRIRCHRCSYRGSLTEVSVEEHMEEETFRY